jgi:hypothetical protein
MSCSSTIHVAQVDANAEPYLPILGHLGLALGHSPLHFNRTPDGVDNARELRKEAVAGVLYDPAAVLPDFGVNQLPEMGLQPLVGPLLIGSHQARISCHVGGEDRGEAADRGMACPAVRCLNQP